MMSMTVGHKLRRVRNVDDKRQERKSLTRGIPQVSAPVHQGEVSTCRISVGVHKWWMGAEEIGSEC